MELRLALIGAGFIGKSHALAMHAVDRVFPRRGLRCRPYIIAEADEARARVAADALGFPEWTTSWEQAIDRADAVVIAVPSALHRAIAAHAIAARKPLLCEKPVGLSSQEASELAAAAAAAGVSNAVGFTYVRAPMVQHAKALLASGKLGKPVHFTGRHVEDYLADAEAPHSWRLSRDTAGRCGALGDLGCHILSIARELCGPIAGLVGTARTVHARRPIAAGASATKPVENEDFASAILRFADGTPGLIETSRVAHGRKMDLSFELTCERGTIRFEAERLNELKLYLAGEDAANAGFRTILVNPLHPDYAGFLPAPGHGLGFNDLKTIELHQFLEAVAAGRNAAPDLHDASRIARLCEAILDSAESGRWIEQPEAAR